jgi:propionyl-CoA synthetase
MKSDLVHERSLRDPDGFWAEAAQSIDWYTTWDRVCDRSRAPFYRWFTGATVNTCYNALDRHVAGGRSTQPALIYDSPVTGTVSVLTYGELLDKVQAFAGALASLGVSKGDRVIIYMPMIPEAAIAMLAVARLGAIHSVVFGGFASRELATRIDDARPTVIVTASCGIEPGRVVPYKPLLDAAVAMAAHKPSRCIVVQRPMEVATLTPPRDLDWDDAISGAGPHDCVPVAATDPLYILYTSGTTSQPKGVVRDNGGHLVALDWSMKNVYGVQPGEVFWAASDIGWVVGHSYIVYGPLTHGSTSVLFEGKPVGTPDAGVYWRVVSQHKVVSMFAAPTGFRAIKREDPTGSLVGKYDLSAFRTLFLAGERTDPDTLAWAQQKLNVPVIDHWWQTETGWPICGISAGIEMLPVKPGSANKPVAGWDVQVLDERGQPARAGQIGSLVCKLPLPPGTLPTLWNADDRYEKTYLSDFPGYYKTADAGYVDADGYVYVMTRTDDVINVAGHRLATGAMEEVLASHPDVAECAVIGMTDALKGQVPVGFVVLKAGVSASRHHGIEEEVMQLVRDRIGPVAAFKIALVVRRLPKTRSGKILRGTMRRIADQQTYDMPATIEDPSVLGEIEEALRRVRRPGAA